jgi:hypothetical protein
VIAKYAFRLDLKEAFSGAERAMILAARKKPKKMGGLNTISRLGTNDHKVILWSSGKKPCLKERVDESDFFPAFEQNIDVDHPCYCPVHRCGTVRANCLYKIHLLPGRTKATV